MRYSAVCCALALAGLTSLGRANDPEVAAPFVLRQVAATAVDMKQLWAVAVDGQDRVYVAGESGVVIHDSRGRAIRQIATASAARALAVTPDGETLFVALRDTVERYDGEGNRVAVWGQVGPDRGQFRSITGLAAHEPFVYVADSANRRLSRFAWDGDFIDDIEGFVVPSPFFDTSVGAGGELVVVNPGMRKVERYDQNMRKVADWGESGAAPERFFGCCNPAHIAVFQDGRVATSEKGIFRIKVYDPEGQMLAFLGPEALSRGINRMALAIDSHERLVALMPGADEYRIYEIVSKDKADQQP